jgi:hypothetical protein
MLNVTKVCNVCGVEKDLSHFPTRTHKGYTKTYYRGTCKECKRVKNREYIRERRKNNPEAREKARLAERKYEKKAFCTIKNR